MEIGRIIGATRVLGKSQGYYGLPIRDEAKNLGDLPHMLHISRDTPVDGPKTPTMQTVWFPSPDELARLQQGAGIHVSLVGVAHPPISVIVGEVPREPDLTMCPDCMGTGCNGHPDSGNVCYRCNGSGGVPE